MAGDFFMQADATEKLFWALALCGTGFFLLRVLMSVVGGFGAESDGAVDAHHGAGVQDTDIAFKLISINSITGFLMMFGWVGLALYKEFTTGAVGAIFGGLAAGLLSMYLTAFVFNFAMRLASPGERFDIEGVVGGPATVYARIPAQGRGQVQVGGNGLLRTLDAVSAENVDIESFTNVIIVKAVDRRTVAVRKS